MLPSNLSDRRIAMTHNYKSKLREKIAAFLDLKLKQGFIYKNQSILLNELDGYLVLNHPTATTITRDWHWSG